MGLSALTIYNHRFLRSPHSWAPFKNSESALRKILTATKAHPQFLDFVHGFGHPVGGIESDLPGDYGSQVDIKIRHDQVSGLSYG
jgi:hypothetical protein